MNKTSVSTQRRLAAGSPLGGALGTEKRGDTFFVSFRPELCTELSVIMDMFSVLSSMVAIRHM